MPISDLLETPGAAPAGHTVDRDYRPLVERNDTNGLSQAEIVRDGLYDMFRQAADAKRVEVMILKSAPFTYPPWVNVVCWVRHNEDAALTLRSSARLNVRPREFHRFPYEMDLVISNDRRSRTFRCITALENAQVANILDYLLFERKSHQFGLNRCREWPFQLWRTANKPVRLGRDPRAIVALVLIVAGIFTLGFGIGILLLLFGGIMVYMNGLRRRHVLSAGKPAQEPRQLIRLDSWQTMVTQLGPEREIILAEIQKQLARATDDGFVLANEKVWYLGVDGKEEREQMSVRFRRGIVFIQIYPYGDDLFVGWDAHVNCGTWIEQVSGAGYDKTTHELCAVHTIAAGRHVPCEYDVTDTNCLLERVHAAVTQVVRLKMAEHKIDQEIDFTILREARQNIVGRDSGTADKVAGGIRNVLSRIRRVG